MNPAQTVEAIKTPFGVAYSCESKEPGVKWAPRGENLPRSGSGCRPVRYNTSPPADRYW